MAELTASDVADYFLSSVDEESGDNISNLKLQKLVYYAQGLHLAMHDGQPLFDDDIEAWQHGPVVPELYRRYKDHGAGAIPRPAAIDLEKFSSETCAFLEDVWETFGQYSAMKLRAMTHEEPPWKLTPLNCPISRELMRNYFRTLLVDEQK